MNRLLRTILLTSVVCSSMSTPIGNSLRDYKEVHEVHEDIRLSLMPRTLGYTAQEPEPIMGEVIEEVVEPEPVVDIVEEVAIDPIQEYAESLGYTGYYIQMVEVSAYDNCYYCTQSGEGITASGTVAGVGTIAAPINFAFGTQLLIEGFEGTVFTVEDRGGAIYMTDDGVARIDMWVESHEKALQIGRFRTPAYIFY